MIPSDDEPITAGNARLALSLAASKVIRARSELARAIAERQAEVEHAIAEYFSMADACARALDQDAKNVRP